MNFLWLNIFRWLRCFQIGTWKLLNQYQTGCLGNRFVKAVKINLTHLRIVAAADSSLPVWNVNAVRVTEQPVVLFDQEGSGILTHGAVDIVEDGRLVPVHLQVIEPGTRLTKKHPRSNLQWSDTFETIYSGYLVHLCTSHYYFQNLKHTTVLYLLCTAPALIIFNNISNKGKVFCLNFNEFKWIIS